MKNLTLLPLLAFASPALAHTGAHIHPHEAAGWLPLVLGLTAIAGASILAYARSSRK
ncbi:hypothetical protein [Parasedimentitalea psychrophila]|uniref:Peptidase M23 n=1 Tax=Parasedimentitalea psychrophila TaxID=2997337 RepID=A0A9Y2L3C8_9RHOB|nr:hypothetical protein [Parasedimentitalea psychrophila]WIY26134.1 hypothetical protein QPJ95_04185 [Parasedimentitalea psychrophila]